jgi:hypothetical protein
MAAEPTKEAVEMEIRRRSSPATSSTMNDASITQAQLHDATTRDDIPMSTEQPEREEVNIVIMSSSYVIHTCHPLT